MLKPLQTKFKGREINLECTHKREFPPPQMYGSTPEDIDTLWKQGTIDQNQYQHLKVWHDKCSLMVMGPRCLDCPLALKRNPRPGRPNVIETENWLVAKRKIHWADMKVGKQASEEDGGVQMKLTASADAGTPVEELPTEEPMFAGQHDEDYPVPPVVFEAPVVSEAPAEEPEPISDTFSENADASPEPEAEDEEGEGGADLHEDIISALADD